MTGYSIILTRSEDVELDILEQVKEPIANIFNLPVVIKQDPIPLSMIGYHPTRKQYIASAFLSQLKRNIKEQSVKANILTHKNLYAPGLNFVFGQAELGGIASVVSTYYLNPKNYDQPFNYDLFLERIIKEIVHELGHCFGLTHCSNPKCVMRFSNNVLDVDSKEKYFCESCSKKLDKMK